MDTPLGTSAGRQKTLQALEETSELAPVDDPDNIYDLIEAVNDITVPRVLSPPQQTVEQIEEKHTTLPVEAQPHYIADDRLLRHINAARRQFNDWMGKRRRMAEIPSPVEASRANYPTQRAQKRSRLEHEAREELETKLDRVQSTARGAEQRALNAIGSSVGEQTEQRREQQRQELREQLFQGAIVKFRNPQLRAGRVIRVNKKSVRVQYPNPRAGTTCPVTGEEQPDEREDRVQLDSEYLKLLDVETIDEVVATVDELESRK
jgi:cell division septum initiation protein DivIVA